MKCILMVVVIIQIIRTKFNCDKISKTSGTIFAEPHELHKP